MENESKAQTLLAENDECKMKGSKVRGNNGEWRKKAKCRGSQLGIVNGNELLKFLLENGLWRMKASIVIGENSKIRMKV